MFDKIILTDLLRERGYDARSAELVAAELEQIAPELENCLTEWVYDNPQDYEAQGYSIFGLMKSHRMQYPAALLTIDWLIKEPEKAIYSLTHIK